VLLIVYIYIVPCDCIKWGIAMIKRAYILLFILFTVSCFKKPAKVNLVETLSLEEKGSVRSINIPINLQEALAGRTSLDFPNVLIKQQDGYEEFVLDIIEPEHTFDWMLFMYDLAIPESKATHEEKIKIKYRLSRDGVDWSEWRYDAGTQTHRDGVPDVFAWRKIWQRGETETTPPQRYVEFIVVSYVGSQGDTLFNNPSYAAFRYSRNESTETGKVLKKNNKITIWSDECVDIKLNHIYSRLYWENKISTHEVKIERLNNADCSTMELTSPW